MELFEIDHIEVSDHIIDVSYWIPDHNDKKSAIFRIQEYEHWLLGQRDVSLSAYWDQWDPKALDSPSYQIVLDDVRQYLGFKFDMFKLSYEKTAPAYSDKKPMTRVSVSGGGKSGSKSA
jgi:hypothetical protein